MHRVALVLAALGVVAGCELLVGIKGKTEAADASSDADVEDPSVGCSEQPAQPQMLFCDDFDSELEAGNGWLWDLSMGGGSVALDTTQYRTAPKSAVFDVPSAGASGQLGQSIGPQLQTGYRLAFDLRVDVPDLSSIPQVGVAQIYRDTGTDELSVNYVLGPGSQCSVQLFEGAAGTQTTVMLTQVPPTGTWTRIVIVYDVDEGISVIEDAKTIGTSPAAAHGPPGSTSFIVGAVYSNPPPPDAGILLEIDDVVMRGQ
jgi:hypothetical protein